ncbi:MAG: hypothetical protein M5U27_09625 [Gaiella sp.]|nr:hypothetical protein [Gaiella sp.]
MEVKRVDQVELGQVRQVDAHELAAAHADRVARVVERAPVDGVEVVPAVGVRVEAVHHHDELAGGLARRLRVDDERAVEALVDVLLERRRVAVVHVEAGRPGRELVRELLAWADDLEDAVHVRGMDPVKMDRVRVRTRVGESHPQEVVLGRSDHGPRNGAVVRPGGKEDARRDLELLVAGNERVLAGASRPVRKRGRRVEQGVEVVRPADGRRALADHRRVPDRRRPGVGGRRAVRGVLVPRRIGLPCERDLDAERRRSERRRRAEQTPSREFRHA